MVEYSNLEARYDENHLPTLNRPSFIIEQDFLRHIRTPNIPNLKDYLAKLNKYDWTCLLAENPQVEFIRYLTKDMQSKLDWEYIITRITDKINRLNLASRKNYNV